MDEALPTFRYHPDPVATGDVRAADEPCPCCERARGHLDTGPIYGGSDIDAVCAWCIADGSAARLGAAFAEVEGDVPEEVRAEVGERTPRFAAWQQERWLVHRGDACAHLGRVGYDDLQQHPGALAVVRDEVGDDHTEALHPDGDATGYLFRCLHCVAHLAHADAN